MIFFLFLYLRVLEGVQVEVAHHLALTFNKPLRQGIVPSEWMTAIENPCI